MNKIIPKQATLYCPHCLCEQPVVEGENKEGVMPIYCSVCKRQISELIHTAQGWELHACFYSREGSA